MNQRHDRPPHQPKEPLPEGSVLVLQWNCDYYWTPTGHIIAVEPNGEQSDGEFNDKAIEAAALQNLPLLGDALNESEEAWTDERLQREYIFPTDSIGMQVQLPFVCVNSDKDYTHILVRRWSQGWICKKIVREVRTNISKGDTVKKWNYFAWTIDRDDNHIEGHTGIIEAADRKAAKAAVEETHEDGVSVEVTSVALAPLPLT